MKIQIKVSLMIMGLVLVCTCQTKRGQDASIDKDQSLTVERDPNKKAACKKEQILDIAGVSIYREPGDDVFLYESGMTIDADGAPDAYHPEDTGLCYLANAGKPGNWWGIATDEENRPLIQGPGDPYPGYYVSTTSLQDKTLDVKDPDRYVDATTIPYFVLPGGMGAGARIGDFGLALNKKNGRLGYAIFADVGPRDKIGEGSIALAEALRIPTPVNRKGGGIKDGVIYVVFPGSGDRKPRTVREIRSEGERLFKEWGGMKKLKACFPEL